MRVRCEDPETPAIEKPYIWLAVVIVDFISIFVFWLMIRCYARYEERAERDIEGGKNTARDFTVKITNLPEDQDLSVLRAKLWKFIEKLLQSHSKEYVMREDDHNYFKIANIHFSRSDYAQMQRYGKIDYLQNELTILKTRREILENSDLDQKMKEKQENNLDKHIERINKQIRINREALDGCKDKKNKICAFVTFQSMEGKMRLLHLYKFAKLKDFAQLKSFADRKFEDKLLSVSHPEKPTDIIWENMGSPKWKNHLLTLIFILASLVLLCISGVVMNVSKNSESELRETYGDYKCPSYQIPQEDAYADFQKEKDQQEGLMGCF